MVVLATAMIVTLGMVNLHCLSHSAREKLPVQQCRRKGEAVDLTIRLCLVPSVHINIDFDHR